MENKISKPWGSEQILFTNNYWIKLLTIEPLQRTSLHKHNHSNETLTVIQGKAIITLDKDELLVSKHDTVFIPAVTEHRIYNYQKNDPLIICEVTTGSPREGDIFRTEDDYRRK